MAYDILGGPSGGGFDIFSPQSSRPSTELTGQPGVPTNPISYITGMVGNAFKGLGRAALGITNLFAAGVHDTIAAAQELIPGEQQIEHEGYQWANIIRALPELRHDYARRYGGVSNILRGLYEDPFAYISDAFLVAGGVGAAAKAGRVGGIMSKLPTVMADSTAAKVLGVTLKEGMKAEDWLAKMEVASTAAAPGKTINVPLSANPAVRFLQEKGANALSLAPEDIPASFWEKLEDPRYVRARAAVNYASENGIRVFKPKAGDFLSTRATSFALSKLKVAISQKSEAERRIFEDLLKDVDEETLGKIADYYRGYGTVIEMKEGVNPLAGIVPEELARAANDLHPRDWPDYLKDQGWEVGERPTMPATREWTRQTDRMMQDRIDETELDYPNVEQRLTDRVTLNRAEGPIDTDYGPDSAYIWHDENGTPRARIEFSSTDPSQNMLLGDGPPESVPELLDAIVRSDPARAAEIIRNQSLEFTHKGSLTFQRAIRRWTQKEPVFPRVDPIKVETPAEWVGMERPRYFWSDRGARRNGPRTWRLGVTGNSTRNLPYGQYGIDAVREAGEAYTFSPLAKILTEGTPEFETITRGITADLSSAEDLNKLLDEIYMRAKQNGYDVLEMQNPEIGTVVLNKDILRRGEHLPQSTSNMPPPTISGVSGAGMTMLPEIKALDDAFPNGGWDMNNLNTPISGEFPIPKEDIGQVGVLNDVVVYTESMDDAVATAQKALDATGTKFAGVVNTLDDDWTPGDYFVVAGMKPDGQVIHFNIATKELYREQQMASDLIAYGQKLDGTQSDLLEVIKGETTKPMIPGEKPDKKVLMEAKTAWENLQRERQAYLSMQEDTFRGHRMAHWDAHGSPADPIALKAEQLRAASWPTVQRWIESGLSDNPLWTYMERAYGEQRLWRFTNMLSALRDTVRKELGTGIQDVDKALGRMLAEGGIPEPLVTSILGGNPIRGQGFKELGLEAVKGTDRMDVADDLHRMLKDEYGNMDQQQDAAGRAMREVQAAIEKYRKGDDSDIDLIEAALPDGTHGAVARNAKPGSTTLKVAQNHPDLAKLPPVKEGYTRLFRGGAVDPAQDSAKWWTLDYEEAKQYAAHRTDALGNEAGSTGNMDMILSGEADKLLPGRVYYRDLPNSMVEDMRAMNPNAIKSVRDVTDAEKLAYSKTLLPKRHPLKNINNTARANKLIQKSLEESFQASEQAGFFYHWSPMKNNINIQKTGLTPNMPGDAAIAEGYPSGVYFSDTGKAAYDLLPPKGARDSVLYRARYGDNDIKPLGTSETEYISQKAVPPENLEYLGADGNWHRVVDENFDDDLMVHAQENRQQPNYGGPLDERFDLDPQHFILRDKFPGKTVEPARQTRGDLIKMSKQVDTFIRRVRDELKPLMVDEGGIGADFGFPDYDWRVMRKERLEGDMPVPGWLPDIPQSTHEGLGITAGGERTPMLPRKPAIFSREWTSGLAESGNRLNDPGEILSRSAAISIEHAESVDSWDRLLREAGRPATAEELKTYRPGQYNSEVLVSKDGVARWMGQRADIMTETLDALATGEAETFTEAVESAIRSVQPKAMIDGLNAMGTEDLYWLPRSVANAFEKEIKFRFGHAMKVYWDGPMNLWKASVLSLSPRWLINNLFGNQVFMAVENPGAIRLAIEQMDKKSSHFTEQILGAWSQEASRGFFSENQRFRSVIPDDADGLLGKIKELQQTRGAQTLSKAGYWVRNKNNVIEQAARRGTLLNEIQKATVSRWYQGFHSSYDVLEESLRSGKITPAVMEKAIRGVDKTLGNYTQYSALEQGIIRRFLMPFWGFYRHAAKVMLRMPFEHPLKFKVLSTIEQIDREMQPEMPEWMRGRVKLGDLGGGQLLLNLQNMNPLSAFGEGVPLISSLNPVMKIAIERQLGVDTYTGEPFRGDENTIETWNGMYQMMYDKDGNFIGIQQMEGKPLPSLLTHVAQQFPQLQFLSPFQRYPKSSWLQLASYLGVPLSQIDVEGMIERRQEADETALATAENRINPPVEGGGFDILGGVL